MNLAMRMQSKTKQEKTLSLESPGVLPALASGWFSSLGFFVAVLPGVWVSSNLGSSGSCGKREKSRVGPCCHQPWLGGDAPSLQWGCEQLQLHKPKPPRPGQGPAPFPARSGPVAWCRSGKASSEMTPGSRSKEQGQFAVRPPRRHGTRLC